MLQELSIRNFAIIDDLKVEFQDGLTILSGETGAGKSIIINAVNLLLGGRASSDLVRTGKETAVIEARFHISLKSSISELMTSHHLDPEDGLIIRREISRNDRHKIFINNQLGTITLLKTLTENLASISGQHAHQGLLKEEQHLLILDRFGGLLAQRDSVKQIYNELVPLIRQLDKLKKRSRRQDEQIELLKFQESEIRNANLRSGEDEELENERKRLKNGEALAKDIHACIEALYDGEGAVVEKMDAAAVRLDRIFQIDPAVSHEKEKLIQLKYQFEDLVAELRSYADTIQMDDHRLEEVEERLYAVSNLKKKYGGSIESVLAYAESIESELDGIQNVSRDIKEIENKIASLRETLLDVSEDLSQKRKQAAEKLSRNVEKELDSLKMPGTRFEVKVMTLQQDNTTNPFFGHEGRLLTDSGFDRAVFQLAPNVGETLKPLTSIASGGELSRIVLALKVILAAKGAVETVVFDEVDAGIGGGVAEVVGQKLEALSKYHQVICITHLPQIAKFGESHYKISKEVVDERTRTRIRPLEKKERIDEMARMLGGVNITRKTLEHAEEMLGTQ